MRRHFSRHKDVLYPQPAGNLGIMRRPEPKPPTPAMLDPKLQSLLSATVAPVASLGDGLDSLLDHLATDWRGALPRVSQELGAACATAADNLATALAAHTANARSSAMLGAAVDGAQVALVAAWAESAAANSSVVLAPLLGAFVSDKRHAARARRAARARAGAGPMHDALACLPLAGDARWLREPAASRARARVELLLWEAGAQALAVRDVASWLWNSPAAFDDLILDGARGHLRARSVAARTLAMAAPGAASMHVDPAVLGATLRVVRTLVAHPEPVVWVHAVRAMGRLVPAIAQLGTTVSEWLKSPNRGEHRRAVAALACIPNLPATDMRLEKLLDDTTDPWALAAVGPAIADLVTTRRDVWSRLARRLSSVAAGPEVLWGIAQGIAVLSRRGDLDAESGALLRQFRNRALEASTHSVVELLLWQAIRHDTDFLDGIEPDPAHPDILLDRAVATSLQAGPNAVTGRVSFCARSLGSTFATALADSARDRSPEERAAALSVMEGCALAAALQLWNPILRAAGASPEALDRDANAARASMVSAVAERMTSGDPDFPVHRTALRVLAYAIDATEPPRAHEESSERGNAAARVLAIVEKAQWLASRKHAPRFRKPVGDVLWRVFDAVRRTAVLPNDPMLLRRFVAWWALAAETPQLVAFLGRSESAARDATLKQLVTRIQELRAQFNPHDGEALAGEWSGAVLAILEELGAGDTELAAAVSGLASALYTMFHTRLIATAEALSASIHDFAHAAVRLSKALANPDRALSDPVDLTRVPDSVNDLLERSLSVRHNRDSNVAAIAAEWGALLGPVVGPLAQRACEKLLAVHVARESEAKPVQLVEGYTFVRQVAVHGMGEVWQVKNRAGRLMAMKIPRQAFQGLAPDRRKELTAALDHEAAILRDLSHPNLASFIDYGWMGDVPYLVLEWLTGADLDDYSTIKPLSLAECKPIVAGVCAGLSAIHRRGLIHRDMKPGNIFLRLDFPPGDDRWYGSKHRDPLVAPVVAAVVIDFGIVRSAGAGTAGEAAGTAGQPAGASAGPEGTLGFMAPEQTGLVAHAPGTWSDVYGLAATLFAAMTGQPFFAHIGAPHLYLIAHATQEPLAAAHGMHGLPPAVVELLAEATRLDPAARPTIAQFAARFARL